MIAQNYGHCFKQVNCFIVWLMLFQVLQPPGVPVEILRSAQACFDKRSSTREEASVQNLIWLMFIFQRKIWQHLVDVHFCHLSLSLGWYPFYFALLLTIPMKINSSSLFLRTFFLVFKTEAHHNNVVLSRGTTLWLVASSIICVHLVICPRHSFWIRTCVIMLVEFLIIASLCWLSSYCTTMLIEFLIFVSLCWLNS